MMYYVILLRVCSKLQTSLRTSLKLHKCMYHFCSAVPMHMQWAHLIKNSINGARCTYILEIWAVLHKLLLFDDLRAKDFSCSVKENWSTQLAVTTRKSKLALEKRIGVSQTAKAKPSLFVVLFGGCGFFFWWDSINIFFLLSVGHWFFKKRESLSFVIQSVGLYMCFYWKIWCSYITCKEECKLLD